MEFGCNNLKVKGGLIITKENIELENGYYNLIFDDENIAIYKFNYNESSPQ